jgi:hypothetical protein
VFDLTVIRGSSKGFCTRAMGVQVLMKRNPLGRKDLDVWNVRPEDIAVVLAAHAVVLTERQVADLLDQLDTDAIVEGVLSYENFGDQAMSALGNIEDQLIALGIIDSDKLFANPDG